MPLLSLTVVVVSTMPEVKQLMTDVNQGGVPTDQEVAWVMQVGRMLRYPCCSQ